MGLKVGLPEGFNSLDLWGIFGQFSRKKRRADQTHSRTTISVPYGSKSAFECHSCLLVSVDYTHPANS